MSFETLQRYIPFILRASAGIVLIWLGILGFITDTLKDAFTASGFQFMEPVTFVLILGIVELLLGVLLIIGLLTRITAFLSALFALCYLIAVMVWGSQDPMSLVLFGASIVLIITGGGGMSLDHLLKA